MVELRVENVAFLSPDAAALTYRIYYGGSPSPVIHDVQTGTATRVNGHWQLGSSTLCSLAALVGIKCDNAEHVTDLPAQRLRAGEQRSTPKCSAPSMRSPTRPRRSSNASPPSPAATPQRSIIAAGLQQDQAYAGKTAVHHRGLARRRPRAASASCTRCKPRAVHPLRGRPTPPPRKAADGHWYACDAVRVRHRRTRGRLPLAERPDLGPGVEKHAPPASTATAVVGNP